MAERVVSNERLAKLIRESAARFNSLREMASERCMEIQVRLNENDGTLEVVDIRQLKLF